jgi:hypothetical protein
MVEECAGDNYALGSALSIGGNILISMSFQFQKRAHNNNKGQQSYLKLKMWWYAQCKTIFSFLQITLDLCIYEVETF